MIVFMDSGTKVSLSSCSSGSMLVGKGVQDILKLDEPFFLLLSFHSFNIVPVQ